MATKRAAATTKSARLRAALRSVTRRAATAGRLSKATAAAKPVTFICSNPACLVGITSGPVNIVFSGSGGAMFPVGTSPLFYRVQGPKKSCTVTAQGGTLGAPIQGTPAFGGMTTLTVS